MHAIIIVVLLCQDEYNKCKIILFTRGNLPSRVPLLLQKIKDLRIKRHHTPSNGDLSNHSIIHGTIESNITNVKSNIYALNAEIAFRITVQLVASIISICLIALALTSCLSS